MTWEFCDEFHSNDDMLSGIRTSFSRHYQRRLLPKNNRISQGQNADAKKETRFSNLGKRHKNGQSCRALIQICMKPWKDSVICGECLSAS